MKPHSIYREMFIYETWEFGGARILMKLLNLRETVESYICRATHYAVAVNTHQILSWLFLH
jgi:hypothetical protein